MVSPDLLLAPGGFGRRLIKWQFQALRRDFEPNGVLAAPRDWRDVGSFGIFK